MSVVDIPVVLDEHGTRCAGLRNDRGLSLVVGGIDAVAEAVSEFTDAHGWRVFHGPSVPPVQPHGTLCTMSTEQSIDWTSIVLRGSNGKRICSFPGCGHRHNTRGLCSGHHRQRLRGVDIHAFKPRRTGCLIEGCSEKHHANGYCAVHNARRMRNGDPAKTIRITTLDSFWLRVDKRGTGGCWLWTGYITNSGYRQLASRLSPVPSGTKWAHRVAYELAVGPIPDGLQLDHLCRVTACVNPAHLEPVTVAENARRGLHGVLRTRCSSGHLLDERNTWLRESDNTRVCRQCMREREVERRDRIGEELGIHPETVKSRLRRGWSLEDAMTRPVRPGGNRKGSVFTPGQRRLASLREAFRSAGT